MRQQSIQPGDLNTSRLTAIFAVLSLVFVAVLASAPLRPYFAEWRDVQKRYNRLAAEAGMAPMAVGIKQIWKPALGAVDRCTTCHVGMGAAEPVPGDPLFRAHPPIPHDPVEYGCTVCHGGQGRATTRTSAHGFVAHWDDQLLDVAHQPAGCGTCHTEMPVTSREALRFGAHLVESLDCLSCHTMDGRGRGSGPDLTYVGLQGFGPDWHQMHLEERARDETGRWAASYGDISDPDEAAIDSFLRTRTGAPRVVDAQALALERGCLGCHRIGGRGGDEAPALDRAGLRAVSDLDFSNVPGERTLANYMRRHLADPPGIVPGSAMPPQAANVEEADLLTSYVLFLRGRSLPAEYLPPDRVRRELLGEPRPPLGGRQAYLAFCSGCHGPDGEGRQYGNVDVRFPRIGSADFLDVASDDFLTESVHRGRPGRRMPGLGAGGSLSDAEVEAIVAHLRTLVPPPPDLAAVTMARTDREVGARLYRNDCATCHGDRGEGTSLGSPLAAPDSAGRQSTRAAYDAIVTGTPGTAMPRYSQYDAGELGSLLAHLATLPPVSEHRAAWRAGTGTAAEGEAIYGRVCAGCHGSEGEGKSGPALANTAFLAAATPEFIAATVVRGRAGTPMPAFGRDSVSYPRLSAGEVLDVTAFILSWRQEQ
jgi:cytochrome c oxidase cbb3-type subunit III